MKKSTILDISFIILLAILLILFNTFSTPQVSVKFLLIPLLAAYYIGRNITKLSLRKKA